MEGREDFLTVLFPRFFLLLHLYKRKEVLSHLIPRRGAFSFFFIGVQSNSPTLSKTPKISLVLLLLPLDVDYCRSSENEEEE